MSECFSRLSKNVWHIPHVFPVVISTLAIWIFQTKITHCITATYTSLRILYNVIIINGVCKHKIVSSMVKVEQFDN